MSEKSPQELYDERLARVRATVACEPADQMPVFGPYQKYPFAFGGITLKQAMNDYPASRAAWHKFLDYFQPDAAFGPILAYPARAMEAVGWKVFKWPGHGLDDDVIYQYIEGEFMSADEYDEFNSDPSDFMLRKWAPRQFDAFAGFGQLASFRQFMWTEFMHLERWTSPEMQEGFRAITKAGEELGAWWGHLGQFWGEMTAKGFPVGFGAWDWPPFDIIGDTLRGTRGILADMRRHPSKLHDALEIATRVFIDYGSGAAGAPLPYAWVWVHKSTREFMSDAQFKEFYWPYLRKGLCALIDKGIVPVVYWEADWESRIEHIADMPAGKVVYHLSNTNFERAWDALGGRICLAGNVPNIMLLSGTPDDVKAYCKKIIDYTKGKPGLIMDPAVMLDEAKPENLKAMFDFTREYTRNR